MVRLAIGVAVLATAAMAWGAAEPSRSDRFGLEITFPEKWIVGSGDAPLLLVSRSMDEISRSNCVATGEEVAGTRSLTQEQINQGLSQPFGEEFWRQVFASSGLVAEVKMQTSRTHGSGLTVQEAQFELSKQGGAPDAKMSVHQAIFVRPGQTVVIACSARTIAYPKQKAVLAAVIDSVRFDPPSVPVASGDAAIVRVKDGSLSEDAAKKASQSAAQAGLALIDLAK